MTGFSDIIRGLDWSVPITFVMSVIPALICISFHEMCHGAAAYLLGDDTARKQGRLSMNPLRHIDPVGLLMLIIFKFGWAKPVSVDMRRFRHPKRGMALTALAGPVSNLVLAAVVLFLYGLLYKSLNGGEWGDRILTLLELTAWLSIGLGIFNLIPIPPLDGSKVLFALLPDSVYLKLMRYERYGMIIILALVLLGVVGDPLTDASAYVYDKLFHAAQWAYDLTV